MKTRTDIESIPVYRIRPLRRVDEGTPSRILGIPKLDERMLYAIETQKDEAFVFSKTARVGSGDLCVLQRRDGEVFLGKVTVVKDNVTITPWGAEGSKPVEMKKKDVQFMHRAIRFVKEL